MARVFPAQWSMMAKTQIIKIWYWKMFCRIIDIFCCLAWADSVMSPYGLTTTLQLWQVRLAWRNINEYAWIVALRIQLRNMLRFLGFNVTFFWHMLQHTALSTRNQWISKMQIKFTLVVWSYGKLLGYHKCSPYQIMHCWRCTFILFSW